MNFFKRIGAFILALVMLAAGALFFAIAFNLISSDIIVELLSNLGQDMRYQIALGLIGAFFMLIGVIYPYRVGKRLKKDRVISFQNPDGEVTVSLSAIEEYIRKIAKGIPGIKDVRSHVDISKKGIDIVTAVSLTAGSNIPEVTERIQMEVRSKVQGMLGVEEKINIKMHISKIMRGVGEDLPTEDVAEEAHVPFSGIEE